MAAWLPEVRMGPTQGGQETRYYLLPPESSCASRYKLWWWCWWWFFYFLRRMCWSFVGLMGPETGDLGSELKGEILR